jgi:hypothetical protein
MSMFDLYEVVDNQGAPLFGVGKSNKRFYYREQDAKGVATQYNNVTVIQDGEGVQLEGAPFKSRRLVVQEA